MAISKLTLIGGSAGLVSATAGGVAIYLNSGESIRDYIANKNDSNTKFISLVKDAQKALESRYEKGKDHKPKNGNVEVKKDQIVAWCEKSASTKFSSETDPTYLSLKTWCFVDITSLSEKANKNKVENRVYVSDKDGNDEAWKNAWSTYNGGKSANTLRITDSDLTNLNTDNKEKGALDLHKWCSRTGDSKMYQEDSETTYQKYLKWCFKDSAG
ncbi:hypothetical protein A6V39_04430 [Candidatus Mycoplasma haematobovis]|uniref:Uncharacterized protein n=1 Tax=Candidatus Mycoplasma haematobovis TaxID=432608 RepID=A0A1A9QDR3_9MOLU|nr:hypothetical protein [Candidatus Mycoplasma haematobovis]OAL10131.1 hypothetical protein A6V39_04430 [Candidatus Mycoplasma haematobovis]